MKKEKVVSAITIPEKKKAIAALAAEIEKIFGRNLVSTDAAIEIIEKAANLAVDGIHVDVSIRGCAEVRHLSIEDVHRRVRVLLGIA